MVSAKGRSPLHNELEEGPHSGTDLEVFFINFSNDASCPLFRTNDRVLSCSCSQPHTGKSPAILHSLQKTIICLEVVIFISFFLVSHNQEATKEQSMCHTVVYYTICITGLHHNHYLIWLAKLHKLYVDFKLGNVKK